MSWLLRLLGGVSRDDFEKQSKELEAVSEALKVTTEALVTMNTEVLSIKNLQVDPADIQKAVEKGLEKERSEIKLLFATLEASAEERDKDQDAAISRLGLVLDGDADNNGERDGDDGGVAQKVDMIWGRVEDLEKDAGGVPTVDMAPLVLAVGELYDEVFPSGLAQSRIEQNRAATMKLINDVVLPDIKSVENSVMMLSTSIQNKFQKINERLSHIDDGTYVELGYNPDYTFQDLCALFNNWQQIVLSLTDPDELGVVSEEDIKRLILAQAAADQEYTRQRCAIINSAVESMASDVAEWMQDIQKDLGIKVSDADLDRYDKWFNPVSGSHEEFMSDRRHYSWDKNRDGTPTGLNTPNDPRYSKKDWYSGLASHHASVASVSDGRIKNFEGTGQGDYQEFLDFYPVTYNGVNENSGNSSISFKRLESSCDIDSERWSIAPGQTTFPTYDNLQLIEHKLYLLWKLIKDNVEEPGD